MKTVGFIGRRGILGSVLWKRIVEEGDEKRFEWVFFSAEDANHLKKLKEMDIILSCKGGRYTQDLYRPLRDAGWEGFWLDAASILRLEEESCLVLDPVNRSVMERAYESGVKTYVGANCTVSLMMMALAGLFQQGRIEWISSSTYQAAGGAGVQGIEELLKQSSFVNRPSNHVSNDILEVEEDIHRRILDIDFPSAFFEAPLINNAIPWIDRLMDNGQTREEWKGMVECNKILGNRGSNDIKIDGTCVRLPILRCHAQSFTVKLKGAIPLDEIEDMVGNTHEWVDVIPNQRQDTLKAFSTAKVSGTLRIPIGRIRKSLLGDEYIHAFSMGDQLLWGGAEPLRRTLQLFL